LGLLLGLALVFNGILAWRTQHRLDSMLAELRAAGEPVSLADLAPKPISDEKNAAVYLQRTIPRLDAFERQYDQFYQSPLGETCEERENRHEPPTPEQLAAIRKIVDAYPEIITAFQQAAACDEYASLADFSLWPSAYLKGTIHHSGEPRKFARFVAWKMAVLASEGNPDAALGLGVQMLKFARLYDHEPLLVNYLVSIALRNSMCGPISEILYRHQVSLEARARLDAELALQDSPAPLQLALRNERAFSIRFVQEQSGPISAALRWPMVNWMLGELEAENAAYNFVKQPLGLVQPRPDGQPFRLWPEQIDRALVGRLIGNAILATMGADLRWRVWSRCLRVINSEGEYHQRTGKDADNIEQLSLPREAITDPYTGQPLLLKKTDDGWIVYSVGPNGKNDNGNFSNQMDEGIAPPGQIQE
jgi:hypothetical protein